MTTYANATCDTMDYPTWLGIIHHVLVGTLGMGVNDGADWPSRDEYDNGATVLDGIDAWAEAQDMPEDVYDMLMRAIS